MRKKQLRGNVALLKIENDLLRNELTIVGNQLYELMQSLHAERPARNNDPLSKDRADAIVIITGMQAMVTLFGLVKNSVDSAVKQIHALTGDDEDSILASLIEGKEEDWDRLLTQIIACGKLLDE